MTTGRHIVHPDIYDEFVDQLAAKASHLSVGDPFREQVALGPVIDARQRDKIHALVEARTAGGEGPVSPWTGPSQTGSLRNHPDRRSRRRTALA
jgi:acyl-CoA reductase-like NAD-dependent aldehyde dehydrogenase